MHFSIKITNCVTNFHKLHVLLAINTWGEKNLYNSNTQVVSKLYNIIICIIQILRCLKIIQYNYLYNSNADIVKIMQCNNLYNSNADIVLKLCNIV